jgi:hypothetical protein
MKHGRKVQLKIMFVEPDPSSSDTDADTPTESLATVMADFKQQMAQIDSVSKALDRCMIDLYTRARVETTDWMNEPLRPKPSIQAWCSKRGLSRPTIDEFTDACFDAAASIDLESRVVTFRKDDAAILWSGQRRITVFKMIELIPTLFE